MGMMVGAPRGAMGRVWVWTLTALLLLALGTACMPGSPTLGGASPGGARKTTATETPEDGGSPHFIANTTQAQFGSRLRVGAGNIWEDAYVDADGVPRSGLTAGLWFSVRDQPELDRHIRVHRGQRTEIAGYRIRIVDVQAAGVTLSVLLPSDE